MSDNPMTDILKRAEEYCEKGEFECALDLLRSTALKSEPERLLLRFLDDTERIERLAFRQRLADMYASSFDCQVEWVRMLSNKQNAHHRCRELVEQHGDKRERQDTLRHMRFDLAIDSKSYEFLCEDFVWIWSLKKDQSKVSKKIRMSLLRKLARIDDPEAIPVLEELIREGPLDVQSKTFLISKCEELETLRSVFKSDNV